MDRRASYLHIDPRLCQSCRTCEAAKTCRLKAIVRIDRDEEPYIDIERCHDCRVCIPACPHGAVRRIDPS